MQSIKTKLLALYEQFPRQHLKHSTCLLRLGETTAPYHNWLKDKACQHQQNEVLYIRSQQLLLEFQFYWLLHQLHQSSPFFRESAQSDPSEHENVDILKTRYRSWTFAVWERLPRIVAILSLKSFSSRYWL